MKLGLSATLTYNQAEKRIKDPGARVGMSTKCRGQRRKVRA